MKETNLEKCKETAILLSQLDLVEGNYGVIIHPVFNTFVYPYNQGLIDIREEENFKIAKSEFKKVVEGAKGVGGIIFLLNKPYRALYFTLVQTFLSESDYTYYLRDIWVETEFPNEDVNVSVSKFKSMFNKTKKEELLTEEELEAYKNLPDMVEVYRGIHLKGKIKALSWTLSKETAKWFATRFGDGKVVTATIPKKDIIALFFNRNEKEVLLNPAKLIDITEEEVNKEC